MPTPAISATSVAARFCNGCWPDRWISSLRNCHSTIFRDFRTLKHSRRTIVRRSINAGTLAADPQMVIEEGADRILAQHRFVVRSKGHVVVWPDRGSRRPIKAPCATGGYLSGLFATRCA